MLDDDLPFRVVSKVVGLEEVAGEERLQVLDVDLAGSVEQVVFRDFDHLLFRSVSVPQVDGRLLRQLAKDEKKQFVVVFLERQVPGEVALHRLHDGVLLGVDERFEHHPGIEEVMLSKIRTSMGLF